jgi:hypothetical protein
MLTTGSPPGAPPAGCSIGVTMSQEGEAVAGTWRLEIWTLRGASWASHCGARSRRGRLVLGTHQERMSGRIPENLRLSGAADCSSMARSRCLAWCCEKGQKRKRRDRRLAKEKGRSGHNCVAVPAADSPLLPYASLLRDKRVCFRHWLRHRGDEAT